MDRAELTEIFRKLGADDADGWASSQINEGINQLGRFVFLKQAWSKVLDESDADWIEGTIERARSHPSEPYAGVGLALSNLIENGADPQLIIDLVRGVQAEMLFSMCHLLDDPGELPEEVSEMQWALFEIDSSGSPVDTIETLHESVLETDPTGREMRPRGAKID
jgi:hypothetical protein